MNFEGLDYLAIRRLIFQRKASCRQLTNHYLSQIDAAKKFNAFISVLKKYALTSAELVDQRLQKSDAGPLAGLVIAVKDNINFRDSLTTCGSKILANYVSPYNATVIEKLLNADAIVIGKTNMDEFGMGSSGENSFFGPVKNPLDPNRVAGGSSAGSAVAVAASLSTAALGSDTGGSIRQPAAFCGVVGLKPTYGRVSRFGLVAFASSLEQIGPITKSVADAAAILEVIAGHDTKDATSACQPVKNYSDIIRARSRKIRIGLPREYFVPEVTPEIKTAILEVVKKLEQQGAEVKWISLPHTEFAIAAYYIIAAAEASSNLARYDGVRYGFRSDSNQDIEQMYLNSRSDGFGEEVKRRILLGTFVLSSGYYENYYRRAQKVRHLIHLDFKAAFQQCDCLIAPTVPTTAFFLGEKIRDPLQMYLSDVFTVPANLAGIPAMSVPCGTDSNGLPIGLQIMANHFNEETLLQTGRAVESIVKQCKLH
ncbi:MAG: Asp-tRNA(Asn)/Glu-tRNA(Gln) amidotransferase subunit GatA [bacterium]|nr:Asp-tRNA(Asn)/Glu-tRNA(Gln) amidotransferase subunit GatA [bacterium]